VMLSEALQIHVDARGDHSAYLRSLNGSLLRSVSGRDYAPMLLDTRALANGIYLLDLRSGGESLLQPVNISQ
jgi:hypothetical protein